MNINKVINNLNYINYINDNNILNINENIDKLFIYDINDENIIINIINTNIQEIIINRCIINHIIINECNKLQIITINYIKCNNIIIMYNNKLIQLIIDECDINKLFCNHNKLKKILYETSRIKFMDCSYNKLKFLYSGFVKKKLISYYNNLNYLEELYCSHNYLSIFDIPCYNIKKLDCSYNYIDKLKLNYYKQLEYLKCNNNLLFILHFYKNLKYLDCGNNVDLKRIDLNELINIKIFFTHNTKLDFHLNHENFNNLIIYHNNNFNLFKFKIKYLNYKLNDNDFYYVYLIFLMNNI